MMCGKSESKLLHSLKVQARSQPVKDIAAVGRALGFVELCSYTIAYKVGQEDEMCADQDSCRAGVSFLELPCACISNISRPASGLSCNQWSPP